MCVVALDVLYWVRRFELVMRPMKVVWVKNALSCSRTVNALVYSHTGGYPFSNNANMYPFPPQAVSKIDQSAT
jgi:hypothetical protein